MSEPAVRVAVELGELDGEPAPPARRHHADAHPLRHHAAQASALRLTDAVRDSVRRNRARGGRTGNRTVSLRTSVCCARVHVPGGECERDHQLGDVLAQHQAAATQAGLRVDEEGRQWWLQQRSPAAAGQEARGGYIPGADQVQALSRVVFGEREPCGCVRVRSGLLPIVYRLRLVHQVRAVHVVPLHGGRGGRLRVTSLRMRSARRGLR